MASMKQGKLDSAESPRHGWAFAARVVRIATLGGLAGCCAQAFAANARLTNNNRKADATAVNVLIGATARV
jgi:hypothetical protein